MARVAIADAPGGAWPLANHTAQAAATTAASAVSTHRHQPRSSGPCSGGGRNHRVVDPSRSPAATPPNRYVEAYVAIRPARAKSESARLSLVMTWVVEANPREAAPAHRAVKPSRSITRMWSAVPPLPGEAVGSTSKGRKPTFRKAPRLLALKS